MTDSTSGSDSSRPGRAEIADAHLSFGWWALFVFLALGLVLEALHGLKVGYYLDTSNETRRLMWRLAHAHGTLIALVHIAFALSLPKLGSAREEDSVASPSPSLLLASRCLYGCAVLLPLGFFLGGVFIYGGDPGLGIVLTPIGALLGAVAVLLIARSTRRKG
ncbi:MAG: hypothetical protein AB8G23_12005 [Myxococcota bacterium]